MSASPSARIYPATSGMLIRFDAITGTETSGRNLPVIQLNAARGTEVTIDGTRASCQPTPVSMIDAPAASISFASATGLVPVLAVLDEVEQGHAVDDDEVLADRGPDLRTISVANRCRFCGLPPHSSSRRFTRAVRNWLIR